MIAIINKGDIVVDELEYEKLKIWKEQLDRITKERVVLSLDEYYDYHGYLENKTEYLEYKAQADKEAMSWDNCKYVRSNTDKGDEYSIEEWDNCHCTCGLLDYIEDDDKEAIHDLFEETETLFDITDDLTGTINFNQKIQRLVNRELREEIKELKDELARISEGLNGSRTNKGVNKKKTNIRTGAEVMDFMEKS